MSGLPMNAAQRCALERLADLIDQEKLDIYPTLNDEDSYVRVAGELVFTGRLTDSSELRAAIAGGEQEPDVTTCTIHYVEYVENGAGYWDRSWFPDAAAAQADYQRRVEAGAVPGRDDGEYGSILEPDSVVVELTPEGLLAFAGQFACLEA